MTLVQQLKKHCINQNLRVNEPATQLEIEQFEKNHDVKLTDTLKEYFLTFNGTGEGNFCDKGFSFFALNEFKPVIDIEGIDYFKEQNCFVFSEYLLWMEGYAIQLDTDGNDLGIYEICNDKNKVYDSFEDFINEVIQENIDVYSR